METGKENDPAIIKKCCDALAAGEVILVPTETVYGLICDYENTAAREKIYQLKKRDKNKLLGSFLPDISSCGISLPEKAELLARRFMPGALTLVIPDGAGGTFGFRIPDHPFLQKLLRKYGKMLAQTSANLSGTPAALSVPEALSTLSGTPFLVIDGGIIPKENLSSTVVYADEKGIKILREGAIKEEEIRKILFP